MNSKHKAASAERIDIHISPRDRRIYIYIGKLILQDIDLESFKNTEPGKPLWCFGFYRFYCSSDYKTWYLDYHKTNDKDKISFPEEATLLTFGGLYLDGLTDHLQLIIELKSEKFKPIEKAWAKNYNLNKQEIEKYTLHNIEFIKENIANDEHRLTIEALAEIYKKR